MSQTGKKNLVITSIALYFTYFIHGIGASIMGQYKPEFAAHWGAKALSDGWKNRRALCVCYSNCGGA